MSGTKMLFNLAPIMIMIGTALATPPASDPAFWISLTGVFLVLIGGVFSGVGFANE